MEKMVCEDYSVRATERQGRIIEGFAWEQFF